MGATRPFVRIFYVNLGLLRPTSDHPPTLHRPQKICTFADVEECIPILGV